MANPIKLKRSDATGLAPGSLLFGEVAVNTADKVLHFRRQTGGIAGAIEELSGRGGLLFDASVPHKIGDLVSEAGIGYVCTSVPTPAIGAFNPANWTRISDSERGGIAYDVTKEYQAGDIVTNSNVGYIRTGNTSPTPSAWTLADWTEISPAEQGGVQYNDEVSYASGDIVGFNDKFYICIAPTAGTPAVPETFDPTKWKAQSNIAYNAALDYKLGEMVYDGGDIWYASANMAAGELPGADIDWILATPGEVAGKEYSTAALYDSGDMVMNGGVAYYCTTSTTGAWVPGSWARVTIDERGGVVWNAAQSTAGVYVQGDIVTYNDVTYRLTTVIESSLGAWTPTDWENIEEEFGGTVYDSGHQYEIGDIVTVGDTIYVIGEDPGNPGNPMPVGGDPTDPLENTTSDPISNTEQGGVAWVTGTNYVEGDVVVDTTPAAPADYITYSCIGTHLASATFVADITDWKQVGTPEKGGILYDISGDTIYTGGDIVTQGGFIYSALGAEGTPGTFVATEWSRVSEVGGIAHDIGAAYLIGDIVTQAGVVYRCLENIAVPGAFVGSQWEAVDTAGKVYDTTVAYEVGDIVSESGLVYVAINATPGTPAVPKTFDPLDWTKISEQGGTAWAGGFDYAVGDIVTDAVDGIAYKCISAAVSGAGAPNGNITNWLSIEKAGTAWDGNTVYEPGDTVTYGGVIYIVPSPAPAAGDAPGDATWPATTGEKGGAVWNTAAFYVVGDLVTFGNSSYICTTDANDTLGDPATETGNWTLAEGEEYGGRAWQSSLDYEIGDIVYHPIAGEHSLHVKMLAAVVGTAPLGTEADTIWRMFSPERGGVLFSSNKSYIDGDIVSDTTDEVYIHVGGTSIGSNPSTNPGDWKPLGSTSSNAGTGGQDAGAGLTFAGGNNHIPNPADNNNGGTEEYPDVAGEAIGAQWTISGLSAPYTMATGGLSGSTLNNSDTIQWVGGVAGAAGAGTETWFHQAAPSISAERGGLAWQSSETYVLGDIVTDGLVLYTAKAGSTNEQPSANADGAGTDAWNITSTPERGGRAWVDLTTYTAGDIVTDAGFAYEASGTHTGAGVIPSLDTTNWRLLQGSVEQGGVIWNNTIDFVAGDIVTGTGAEADEVYICILNTTANEAVTDTTYWKHLNTTANVNTTYDAAATYNNGDIITTGDDIYVVTNDALVVGAPPGAGWSLSTPDEVGGRAYDSVAATAGDIVYAAGDIVTQGGIVYKALGAEGTGGSFTATEWEAVDLGGKSWNSAVTYVLGDIVTDTGVAYLCAAATSANQPSLTAADWDPIGTPEQGGVFYRASVVYNIGDMITADDGTTTKSYRCTTGYTSAAAGLPADFLAEVGNWTAIEVAEIGGVAYDAALAYVEGDIVVDTGIAYLCTAAGAAIGDDPATDDGTNWTPIGTPEKGGVLYTVGEIYVVGDTVTDPATGELYYCHTAIPGGLTLAPGGDDTKWVSITPAERGGTIWRNNVEYLVGDIVTDDLTSDIYRCIALLNETEQPSAVASATWWVQIDLPERGGIAHDLSIDYLIGDFVAEAGAGFIALATSGPGSADALTPVAGTTDAVWKPLAAAAEVGGLLYSAAKLYAVGAVVSHDAGAGMFQYACNTAIGTPEGFVPAKWDLVTDGGTY